MTLVVTVSWTDTETDNPFTAGNGSITHRMEEPYLSQPLRLFEQSLHGMGFPYVEGLTAHTRDGKDTSSYD
jgi:hypothetical protein